ncbi:penicillin-binding protein 1A [Camelimonas sp. ID_303_24]
MRFVLRFIAFLFGLAFTVAVVGAAAVGYFIWHYSQDLPDYTQLRDYEPPVMTRFHARDGRLLAEYARERRLFLPIQAVPRQVVAAFLSAEDKNFYSHVGVDPFGTLRAVVQNVGRKNSGQREQGASTITQQVAKNFLVGNERSYERKIREALVALRIENAYTKDKILELYLNEIYLGSGNYGVAAAALNYFGKSVHELTVAEAAYLAALPKAPNNYNAFRHTVAATDRRNWVIERMYENDYITREQADQARKQPLGVSPRSLSPNTYAAGYFAEEVRREIAERYGEKKLYDGGLSVRTTLDPTMQAMARKALVDGLVRYDEARGWHGVVDKIDLRATADWGKALGELKTLTDVQPWRLAVVLESNAAGVRIGLQPERNGNGSLDARRVTGQIDADGVRWTRKGKPGAFLSPGDVIYAEPIEKRPGFYRLRQIPAISGAMVAMDPLTGRVFAMVGGFSFDQSEFNRATQAQRQPGSSFKPIVYATALDNGYTPSTTVYDSPIEIEQGPGLPPWRPENYSGKFSGPHTLRYGIEQSRNVMTVRLARDIGMPVIAEYSRRFGVYDELQKYLPMSLGAGETTVMRMTAAYSMFANGGKRIKPTLIDRIQDRWGKTIYRHDERICENCSADRWANQAEPTLVDKREQVIDPLTAYQITHILEGVVQRGTATMLKALGKPLAGKTGTTNDAKDVWFVGFSPDLAVGVYLGYDQPRSLGGRVTAGHLAAPVVRDFLNMALKDKAATPFRVPPGIKLVKVNAKTGLRAGGEGGAVILEAFKPGTAPPDYVAGGESAPRPQGSPQASSQGAPQAPSQEYDGGARGF